MLSAAVLMAAGCAAPPEISPPENLPSYVRAVKAVRLQADNERVDTGIDLREEEYVSVMATGKVDTFFEYF